MLKRTSRILLFAVILSFFGINYLFSFNNSFLSNYTPQKESIKDSTMIKAFNVLEQKCNACHQKKKPSLLFTMANMNTFAFSIHKEVFIRKKMPKGKDFPLTFEDEEALKLWLKSQDIGE